MLRSTSEMLVHYRETIGERPPRLIGASITLAGSKLYLFGGALASASEIRLLSALYAFDLELLKWERIKPTVDDPVPNARYFHTTDIWNNHLVVFGGLGARGSSAKTEQLQVLNDVRLFNISTRRWLPPPTRIPTLSPLTLVPRPRHAHLSCISLNRLFIIGGKDFFGESLDDVCVYDLGKKEWIQRQRYPPVDNLNHALAATSRWHTRTPPPPDPLRTGQRDNLVHPSPLSYSERATNKLPSDIYVYNADHPERRLEVISLLPNAEVQVKNPPAEVMGQSPCLHFPSGGMLGNKLILAGKHAAENQEDVFFIWALDVTTNTWSLIDTGETLKNASWATGYLWHSQSKFVVFKSHTGAFIDAPDRLVLGWDDVAVVDLEALGIYQPPPLKMDDTSQRLGLASLTNGKEVDFDFLCEDGRRIQCWRKIIMERWPWFQEQQVRLGDDPSASIKQGKRTEVTVTRTSCSLSQSYPVTMALLQYFYSMALGTALQRAPAVLSYLLLISTEFQIPHLQALVRHAMHLALSEATAAGVYEIAASCGCRSLQIR
ncbi:galactose oxidase [Mycena latifolia]|nr:galactose oxidase [Mycena latifolia]